jgi:hypothetical protein
VAVGHRRYRRISLGNKRVCRPQGSRTGDTNLCCLRSRALGGLIVAGAARDRRLGRGDRRLESRGQDRLVAGVVKQLGHCLTPRLGRLCAWSGGVPPPLDDRSRRRLRGPSLAEIVDKGAYTGCLGYTHPTPALRPVRDLTGRGPVAPKKPRLWTMAQLSVGWATPTRACARPSPGPEPRPAALAIPAADAGQTRQAPLARPRSGVAAVACVRDVPQAWRRRRRLLGSLAAMWEGAEPAGRLNPASGLSALSRPSGCGWRRRG